MSGSLRNRNLPPKQNNKRGVQKHQLWLAAELPPQTLELVKEINITAFSEQWFAWHQIVLELACSQPEEAVHKLNTGYLVR